MRRIFTLLVSAALLLASTAAPADEAKVESTAAAAVPWRHDPTVRRHPGSYFGGGIGYALSAAWIEKNDDHGELAYRPLHGYDVYLRVGDAFAEWFSLGFQMGLISGMGEAQLGGFALMLDSAFYPVAGLVVRPNVGLGIMYAQGEKEWELGYGGPAVLSLALGYELRVTRRFYLCPTASLMWVTKNDEDFDSLTLFVGIEFIKWFETATG